MPWEPRAGGRVGWEVERRGQEVSEKKVNGARSTLRKVWTRTLLLPFLWKGFFFHSKLL